MPGGCGNAAREGEGGEREARRLGRCPGMTPSRRTKLDRVRAGSGAVLAFLLVLVGGLAAGLPYATASGSPIRRELIGQSVRGRAIYVYRLGRSRGGRCS